MRTVRLYDGRELPAVGLGTWGYGADPARHKDEVRALASGLDEGLSVIDTAEFYAAGGAEQVVGEAVAGRREDAFVVTKVWPQYTDAAAVRRAVLGSLARLKFDYLDAVLIHWPSRALPPEVWLEPLG
ncbi:MAG: aldo/keto reductase, partial [Clostridia bacterium]